MSRNVIAFASFVFFVLFRGALPRFKEKKQKKNQARPKLPDAAGTKKKALAVSFIPGAGLQQSEEKIW